MAAPSEVLELVERFRRNLDVYTRPDYKETQARVEFIDPFFEALGWDVRNVQGYAEQYKDVIHEDALKVGGATRAPDYCFRIGGVRKFFLEAKKPSVAVKGDVGPAYQLRRYAWSAKLPLSILTDFEEFAVYDCRIRPKAGDKAGVGRVMYYTFDQYPTHWADIHDVFARESVLRGSFDRYVTDTRGKRGTSEVDAEFLKEIEGWREALARNLALRNPALSVYELNFAVQRTIDRLIFMRMAEDRGIEEYGRLLALTAGPHIYERLADDLYRQADEKYNSGLFDFRADTLTRSLGLDDKVIKPILTGLYYPDCPYEFSVLPAEVLGQVYEQFLGKVIRLTPGHRAVVEEKPEVKKAGGVYYTPAYIVDYIVQQTVGKLVEGQSPRQLRGVGAQHAAPLRVLDPACGSGSFLLGAYQYLLAHYRRWYEANDPQKHAAAKEPPVYQGPGGAWRLTTAEKKRILLDHIYGVDIDRQAVEVTKLSLLLQVLAGETDETLGQQLALWRERALPDLDSNIKCGNSLIGPDYFAAQLMPDEDELRRVNPFDWRREFPEVFPPSPPGRGAGGEGGFDAVIGNPPYIDSEWMTKYLPECRKYCTPRYRSASGNWDIFCVFVEKALDLCKLDGFTSLIVPNKLGSADYAAGARDVLSVRNRLVSLRDYSCVPVFPVSVYPIVYVAQKTSPDLDSPVIYDLMDLTDNNSMVVTKTQDLDYQRYFSQYRRPWPIFSETHEASPVDRLRKEHPDLGSVADVLGAATVSEAYELKPLISESPSHDTSDLWVVNSGTIDRYCALWGCKKLRYLGESYLRPVVSSSYEHRLPDKRRQQSKTPKIIIAGMTKVLECTVDLDGSILAAKSTSIVLSKLDLKYLLGLLNSRLLTFYYQSVFAGNKMQGGYLRIGPPQLRELPIRTINFHDPADVARHDRLVALVEGMLDLHKKLAAAAIPADRTLYQRQIEATDRQIDALVYELYGLTEQEIAIVEASR